MNLRRFARFSVLFFVLVMLAVDLSNLNDLQGTLELMQRASVLN